MKNSNIIISVIIVLCIAGGVTAYSITNPEGSIFSLPGFTPSSDNGAGDLNTGGNGVNNGTTGNSSGSNSGGSSGQRSGGSGSNAHNGITSSQAQSIINGAVDEPGSYAGKAQWDGSINMWVSKIYDKDGNVVDAIGVDSNKRTNRV